MSISASRNAIDAGRWNNMAISPASTANYDWFLETFCRAELEVFQDTLGAGVIVERTDHILAGARRCAYRITAKVPEGGRDGLD